MLLSSASKEGRLYLGGLYLETPQQTRSTNPPTTNRLVSITPTAMKIENIQGKALVVCQYSKVPLSECFLFKEQPFESPEAAYLYFMGRASKKQSEDVNFGTGLALEIAGVIREHIQDDREPEEIAQEVVADALAYSLPKVEASNAFVTAEELIAQKSKKIGEALEGAEGEKKSATDFYIYYCHGNQKAEEYELKRRFEMAEELSDLLKKDESCTIDFKPVPNKTNNWAQIMQPAAGHGEEGEEIFVIQDIFDLDLKGACFVVSPVKIPEMRTKAMERKIARKEREITKKAKEDSKAKAKQEREALKEARKKAKQEAELAKEKRKAEKLVKQATQKPRKKAKKADPVPAQEEEQDA